MDARELRRSLHNGDLLGRELFLKPSTEYAQLGVDWGIAIAADDGVGLLLAIHGRLDDRVWVSPAKIKSLGEYGTVFADYLTSESRAALALDLRSFGVGSQALPAAERAARG